MKKLLLRWGLVATLILSLFSCGKSYEHESFIPKDAAVVFAARPVQIAEKADLASSEHRALFEILLAQVGNEELLSNMRDLFDKPEEVTGIDFDAPVYGFLSIDTERSEPKNAGLTFMLEDADAYKKFIRSLDKRGDIEETHSGDYTIFKMDKEVLLAFDDNKALFFIGDREEVASGLEEALSRERGDSFASTDAYDEMIAKEDDFEGVINMSAIMSMRELKREFRYMPKSLKTWYSLFADQKEGIYYILALNGEEGELKFTAQIYSENDEYNKMLDAAEDICPEIEGDFLDYIPKDALLAGSFAFDGGELWNYLQDSFPDLMGKVEKEGNRNLALAGVTVEDLFKTFKGDITASLSANSLRDLKRGKVEIKAFVQLEDEDLIAGLLDKAMIFLSQEDSFQKVDDHQYFIDMEMPMNFGLNGDVFYFSTGYKQDVDDIFDTKESIADEPFDGKNFAATLNIEQALYMDFPYKSMLNRRVLSSLEKLESVSCSSEVADKKSEVVLKLKDDTQPYQLLLDIILQAL